MAKDLKAHMILHDAKKTHSCNQCGYSSIRADKLKRHMLVHSGEKPFSCAHCNHFFSGDKHANLFICLYSVPAFMHNTRKSKDTYSNTLQTYCTQCKYSYTTDGALKLHIQTHTGEKISVAFSATIPAPELAPLRLTCSPIQEISLLDVHSVTIPA